MSQNSMQKQVPRSLKKGRCIYADLSSLKRINLSYLRKREYVDGVMAHYRLREVLLCQFEWGESYRLTTASEDHDILFSIYGIGYRAVHYHAADERLPYDLARICVEGAEATILIAPKEQVSGRQKR